MRNNGKYVVVNDDGRFRAVFEREDEALRKCREAFEKWQRGEGERLWIVYP